MKLNSDDRTLAENKVLILYILSKVGKSISHNELLDLVVSISDMNYFYFEQFLLDLYEDNYIIKYKKEDDEIYLERRMINAVNSNLERLIEIHRSIILAPKTAENLAMRETIYQYLRFVYNEHKQIFDYLINEKTIASVCNVTFDTQAEDVEKLMMTQLNKMENLQPLHYWNMLIEAERILYKCWSLVQVKRKILGEVKGELQEEDLYRLQ